jgi:hypothetical protein
MKISINVISKVENLLYLGSFVHKDGSFDIYVKHRIKCAWMKSRETFYVIGEFQ